MVLSVVLAALLWLCVLLTYLYLEPEESCVQPTVSANVWVSVWVTVRLHRGVFVIAHNQCVTNELKQSHCFHHCHSCLVSRMWRGHGVSGSGSKLNPGEHLLAPPFQRTRNTPKCNVPLPVTNILKCFCRSSSAFFFLSIFGVLALKPWESLSYLWLESCPNLPQSQRTLCHSSTGVVWQRTHLRFKAFLYRQCSKSTSYFVEHIKHKVWKKTSGNL